MAGLIKVRNSDYSRYEELLLRRDRLEHEAYNYEIEYIRLFGDKVLKAFKEKIKCVQIRQEINYCRALLNRGEPLDQAKLDEHIKSIMKFVKDAYKEMVLDNNNIKNSQVVPEIEVLEIKKIYRRLAKKIHPDINPITAETPELMELWHRISVAYKCNNLKDIKEAEILVEKVLEEMLGGEKITIEIPNIEEKIEEVEREIVQIKNSKSYRYKYILESEVAIEREHKILDEDYEEYKSYARELKELLQGLKNLLTGE